VGRFTSIDPLADKYHSQTGYAYAVNNSVMNVDYMGMEPQGKQSDEEEEKQRRIKRVGLTRSGVGEDRVMERNLNEVGERTSQKTGEPKSQDPLTGGNGITPIFTKGAGQDGRDLLTINFTGKFLNLSGKDVDMEKALSRIKNRMESVFKGENVKGVDMNLNFNFSVAESIKEVNEGDHLLILANGIKWNIPGIASDIGGTVATLDAEYFRGFYDSSIGGEGVRTATHELGHLLGLDHVSSPLIS